MRVPSSLPSTLPSSPPSKLPVRLITGLLALPVLAAVALLWLGVASTPLVTQTPVPAPADIERALQVLQRNDPRGKLPGITRSVRVSQRELELLLNLAGRRYGEPRARVDLQPGVATLRTSLALPANPIGNWLNVTAVLHQTSSLPTLQRLQVGSVPVPGWLAEALLPRALASLRLRGQVALVQRMVSTVTFGSQHIALDYAWPDNPQRDLANSLLPAAEQARLQVYSDQLARLSTELAPSGPVSMARLLPPVFALAQTRSTDQQMAVLENRAALVALAFLVNGKGVPALRLNPVDADNNANQRAINVTLMGRQDTPQHFLVSAALSAEGGGPLSDAIGLYKEVADSRGGSGFSFNDLAADRAGTRLGLLAARDPLALQARLAAGVQEADLMPKVSDLPEAMTAQDFQRRFGGVGGPAYLRMMQDIEARLDQIALLAPQR